jgi:hypothetical protein
LIHEIGIEPKPKFQSMVGQGVGKWGGWFDSNAHWYDEGIFAVNWIGFTNVLSLHWKVQGQALIDETGSVVVNGVTIQYVTRGGQLTLTVDPIVIVDVEIDADIRDSNGRQGAATLTARTVEGGISPRTPSGVAPPIDEYLVAYKEHIGPWIEVDPESVANQGYRTDREVPQQAGPIQ